MAKVKMKTKKSAAKRFKLSGSGKLMRKQAARKHLLIKKTSRRQRALKGKKPVSDSDLERVTAQLPYKKYLR